MARGSFAACAEAARHQAQTEQIQQQVTELQGQLQEAQGQQKLASQGVSKCSAQLSLCSRQALPTAQLCACAECVEHLSSTLQTLLS